MDAWAVTSFRIDDEIELRQFTPDDVDIVFAAVSRDAEHLMEFMHWMVPDYSREMSRDFLNSSIENRDKRESLGYGILKSGMLVGSIGFVAFDWRSKSTEIGYWIDSREEGKGIVSRATKRLIDYAFSELDINRIEIRCAVENLRSAAIPERLGFKKEGCLRQSQFRNGKLHDFLVFGLLQSEWQTDDHA